MSEARFKEEVSRRVAAELKRLEREVQQRKSAEHRAAELPKRAAAGVSGAPAAAAAWSPSPSPASVRAAAEPAAVPRVAMNPTAIPQPGMAAVSAPVEPSPAAPSSPAVMEEPARIKRVIKPVYPGAALRARIGGTVILRVLVSETGAPIQVDVIRGITGGLSEAAASAVRRWTFEPARRNGVAVQSWTTVPIPFEP